MTEAGQELAVLGVAQGSLSEKVLRLMLELSVKFIHADEGSLLVYDPRSKDLVFALTMGNEASERMLRGQHVPMGSGITGLAAVTREVQIGAPTFKDINMSERLDKPGTREPDSVIAAPMLVDDKIVGVITGVTFENGKRFTSSDAHLFALVATIAGVVVDQNARLNAGESAPRSSNAEREIAEIVRTIAQRQPDKLIAVRDLLKSVLSLS